MCVIVVLSWIYATHLDLVVCHKKFVNIRTCTIVHILIKVESEVLLILIVVGLALVSVPDPKPTPVRIAFSISHGERKRYTRRVRSGDQTRVVQVMTAYVAQLKM